MITPDRVFRLLYAAYGEQHWWPGETDFEIAVGAILTQNVSWTNVETGIARLREHRLLSPRAMYAARPETIAPLIRSTGYFNQKALKLKRFLEWFSRHRFSFDALRAMDTHELRKELLAVNGIGPETADSILLYALGKRIFVVDAYTRRIFERLGLLEGGEGYAEIQDLFHRRFSGDVQGYNEYHALIVRHGKDTCRKTPRCGECCLRRHCTGAARIV